MRPVKFTHDQIIEAGLELVAAGVEVTGWKLRESLGAGNPARHFKIWQERLENQIEPLNADLPEELKSGIESIMEAMGAQLTAMFRTIHQSLIDEAGVKIQEAQDRLEASKASMDLEVERLASELERLDTLKAEQEELIADAANEHQKVLSQLHEANVSIAHLKEKVLHSDALMLQQEETIARTSSANADLALQLTTQAGLLAAADQRSSDLQLFLDSKVSELKDARMHEQAAREREAVNAGQIAMLEKERVKDAVVTQKVRLELSEASNKIAVVTSENLSLAQEITSLRGLLDESSIAFEALKKELQTPSSSAPSPKKPNK